jgi:hypothetical protein
LLAVLYTNGLLHLLTVHPLLICESLRLLRLVPVQDESVPEGERGSSIGSTLIAVVQRTRESGLNVADSLLLKVFRGSEGLGGLSNNQSPIPIWSVAMQLSWANKLTNFFQAARWGSGMLASTLLMSPGPNPVTVLLCFGLVKLAGPTGPLRSASGALVDGRRSRAGEATMLKIQLQQRSNYWGSDGLTKGKGGVEGRIVK